MDTMANAFARARGETPQNVPATPAPRLHTIPDRPRMQPTKRSALQERELLWEGDATVAVKIVAVQIHEGKFVGNPYIQLPGFAVRGGEVRRYFHVLTGEARQVLGKTLTCKARVWRKQFDDGRQYVYIDYYHTGGGERPTHLIRAFPGSDVPPINALGDIVESFDLPNPCDGRLIIGTFNPS